MEEQQHIRSIHKVSKDYRVLGTWCDLALYGEYDTILLDAAYNMIQYYEDLFTVNRDRSEVMRINHAAGDRAVGVSNATYTLIKRAVNESRQHYGFNAAIGPLVKLWHIGFEDARVPTNEEISECQKLINPDNIVLNDDTFSVYLTQKGMELDLGGIAKGYIADRIHDFWRAYGLTVGIVNLGGNLLMMGDAPHHADGKWRVGIRNPLTQTDETIVTITTGASSVVTSGIAERHFEVAGKSYHHIIDPETGYPHDNDIASVTVLSRESIDGEIETTRLFFADAPLPAYDYGAMFIYKDKSIELVNLPQEAIDISNPEFYFKESKK